MPRKVAEWIGSSDDAAIPERVRLRVVDRQGGKCALTGMPLTAGHVHIDHIVALRDGGENRETNLQAVADVPHRRKTAEEAGIRKKVVRVRKKHLGIREKKPWSTKWKKKLNGEVVRRED